MTERKALVLRISKGLWQELQRMAGQELRSVNAQIEYLLREAVAKRGRRIPDSAPEPDEADEG